MPPKPESLAQPPCGVGVPLAPCSRPSARAVFALAVPTDSPEGVRLGAMQVTIYVCAEHDPLGGRRAAGSHPVFRSGLLEADR
jgi:hypothetical protein